jgi:oligopeptide transport system substrate-binding protein
MTKNYRGSKFAIDRRTFIKNLALAGATVTVAAGSSSLLAGCGSSETGADADAEANAPITSDGQILKLALSGEPSGLDTNYVFDSNSNRIVNPTTPALFRLDSNGIAQPDLTASYTISDDKLIYTITLKDAVWTSGAAVTAHDFVYSWKRLADPANAFGNSYFLSAAGIVNAAKILEGELPPDDLAVQALDDKTLEITLERPVPYVERILVNSNVRPIEQTFFEAQGAAWGTSPETHNSAGPYKLSFYEPANPTIELVHNPEYYDSDKIPFDGLHFQVITDNQQQVLSFENGDLDIVELSGDLVENYLEDPRFFSSLRPQLFYIALNTIIPGLDSPKLRQALGFAIDKEYLASNILKDGSIAAHGFVPVGFAVDSQGRDFREVSGEFQLTDKAKALQLWQEVQAEQGIDSITLLTISGEGDFSQRIAQYIQAQIQDTLPGVTIELHVTPDNVWYEELERREWGLDIDWWWGGYPDAAADLQLLNSFSPYNFSGYANQEFDDLIKNADLLPLAADEQARIQSLADAERIILEQDAAVLPLFQVTQGFLVNPALEVEFQKGNGQYILETIQIK